MWGRHITLDPIISSKNVPPFSFSMCSTECLGFTYPPPSIRNPFAAAAGCHIAVAIMSSRVVVLATYRILLKAARDIKRRGPLTIQALPFEPGGPRVVPTGVAHQDALDGVLPPSALRHARTSPHNGLVGAMSGDHVFAVVRACFREGAAETDPERAQALVNEGFSAIRILGHQQSVQDTISVAVTEGVRVTAISQPDPPRPVESGSLDWQDPSESSTRRVQLRQVMSALPGSLWQSERSGWSTFQYRIRIDNLGEETVTVLGREWKILNGDGSLHGEIRRGSSASRMVVGVQPILEPGDSFIYHSGTDVKSSSGYMEGFFEVARGAVRFAGIARENEGADLDLYYARVAPFKLRASDPT